MPKVQIQFHAEPDEAVTLARRWADEHRLSVAVEQFFPVYRALADEEAGTIDRVALCRRPPDLSAASAHEFVGSNPNCLFLSVGRLDDEGLRESALAGETDDRDTLRLWRDLVRQAKSEMHRGATVRNPHSGAAEPVRTHLHTPGAHKLAQDGVKMLAAAGWNEYDFDDGASWTALRVEWSFDRDSAEQSLQEAVVTSPDELDRLLDELDAQADKPLIAELVTADGARLGVGVGAPVSVLSFKASDDPPYFLSLGRPDAPEDDSIEVYFQGEWSELPATAAVPVDVAREAVRQLLLTGGRPDVVAWQEV